MDSVRDRWFTHTLTPRALTPRESALASQTLVHTTGDLSHQISFPILPPEEKCLDSLFFRKLFVRAESLGYYTKGKGIHVSLFHKFCRRLSDAIGHKRILFDPHKVFSPMNIASNADAFIDWNDMRHALEDVDAHGKLVNRVHFRLKFAERIDMVFSGDGSSWLGSFWAAFTLTLIIYSVLMILIERLHDPWVEECIVLMFTLDWAINLTCSPFVRYYAVDTDRLITLTVPDKKVSTEEESIQAKSHAERIWLFVSHPINLVDLAAVLPFWMNKCGFQLPIKLGFLRAVRILRVFHAMKLGAFSDSLWLLGETLRRSAGSLLVMAVWIVMIAVLSGAVLQQFEEGGGVDADGNPMPWSFDRATTSMAWVAGRLCNMHGSLQSKHHIPQDEVSNIIVMFLGICKGCVLMVPVGQIASAFRGAQEEFKKNREVVEQISRDLAMPLGTEWVRDLHAPAAECEVFSSVDGSSAGMGTFNLPLLESREVNVTVTVPINSIAMQGFFGGIFEICKANPILIIKVKWEPSKVYRSSRLTLHAPKDDDTGEGSPSQKLMWTSKAPEGRLTLSIEQGIGFRGHTGQQWAVCLRVPVKLHGKDAMQEWTSGLSTEGAPEPMWGGIQQTFHVAWEEGGVKKISEEEKEVVFKKHVADCMKRKSRLMRALESAMEEEQDSQAFTLLQAQAQPKKNAVRWPAPPVCHAVQNVDGMAARRSNGHSVSWSLDSMRAQRSNGHLADRGLAGQRSNGHCEQEEPRSPRSPLKRPRSPRSPRSASKEAREAVPALSLDGIENGSGQQARSLVLSKNVVDSASPRQMRDSATPRVQEVTSPRRFSKSLAEEKGESPSSAEALFELNEKGAEPKWF